MHYRWLSRLYALTCTTDGCIKSINQILHFQDEERREVGGEVPLIVVTVPHDTDLAGDSHGWESSYKNFKFRSVRHLDGWNEMKIFQTEGGPGGEGGEAGEDVRAASLCQRVTLR